VETVENIGSTNDPLFFCKLHDERLTLEERGEGYILKFFPSEKS
jgi:hypothetical protein